MKIKIRKLCISGVVLLLVLILCLYGNLHLTVTYYTYESEKLPPELDGLRIVQLSDLHNASFGRNNSRLLEKMAQLEPDILVLTGDLVDSSHTNIETALSFAREAAGICDTYYVTGNHEYWLSEEERITLFEGLKEAGVICLSGETAEFQKGESRISLVGLDDNDLSGVTLQKLLSALPQDELHIVLAHEPQLFDEYCQEGADLVLTGHAHGGQVRIPFVGGLIAPDQGFFPEYTEGTFQKDGTVMVVSRGLGNSVIPVRVLNFPEIVCVDLAANRRPAS